MQAATMSAPTDATLAVDPLSTGPIDPTGVPHLQDPQQHAEHGTPLSGEEAVQAASTGKRERKSGHKEAPKKIYFCAKPDCSHAFEGSIGRRPCYVQNGSFSKGQHKKACGGGYRWLELRDVEREPHVQLEQAGQQFFLNVTGPHTLEPRQGRAGHSPHMLALGQVQRGEASVVIMDPTPEMEPGNIVITSDDTHAAYDGTSEAALAQAALAAGQQHHVTGHLPTGPPADVQAAMASVPSDIQQLVQSLWEQVAGMQKAQAELQHRTSAAEQAAQLLVGAAQRERAASAAAAAESKQIRTELQQLKQAVAELTARLGGDAQPVPSVGAVDMGHHHDHHHHDMGAVSAPMDHHAAAAAAAANAGVPLDMGPADDPAHAPIPGLEPVDHPLPDDSPQVGKTGRADEELPPAKRMRATAAAK